MISAFSKQYWEIFLTFCSCSNFPNSEIWGNNNLQINDNNKKGNTGKQPLIGWNGLYFFQELTVLVNHFRQGC